jgi:hypothetical protein
MEEGMKNNIFILVLSIIIASGVWAQNLPGGIWSSPQSDTTEGRYRSSADDFIRPDNYSGVRFDKWFSMVSFRELFDDNNETYLGAIATAGFATRVKNVPILDSLYVAGFYSGNFWTGAPVSFYTEQAFTEGTVSGATANKTYKVYPSVSVFSPPANPVNNFALLIGAADMGFRLTYRTNHQSFNKSDIIVGNETARYQLYKKYQAASGYIAPQIAWAMAKNLTPNGIRPYITADLVFNRDYLKNEAADGISGERILNSENHFDPSLTAGLGGYTFYNKDGFRFSADLDYALTMRIYNNKYSYLDGDQLKTGKIKGTFRVSGIEYEEYSYSINSLTPSLSGQWGAGRLALRLKLNLPLTLSFQKQNPMILDNDTPGKLIYDGVSKSTSIFTFRPDVRLALQYRIIQDRITLNAGARIQASAITLRTTSQKRYAEGNITESSKVHETTFSDNSGGGSRFTSRFSIGVTGNLTRNVWLEANTGISGVYGNNAAIDIFVPSGLFSFGNLMIGLRF